MAYNTNTERLLNAIKSNTANSSVTLDGDINAIDADTKTAIENTDDATAETKLDTNYLVLDADGTTERGTNLASINTAVGNLRGGVNNTGENTLYEIIAAVQSLTDAGATLESLRLLLDTIDADTSNIDTSLNTIEDNSNQSLGKNGSILLPGATNVIGSAGSAISSSFNIAVQFLGETTITNYQVGTDAEQTSLTVVIPAGTIIYGDIRILVVAPAKNFILYKA